MNTGVHRIPVKLEFRGVTDTQLLEIEQPPEGTDGPLTTRLRGRCLRGRVVPLPPGTRGIIALVKLGASDGGDAATPARHEPSEAPASSSKRGRDSDALRPSGVNLDFTPLGGRPSRPQPSAEERRPAVGGSVDILGHFRKLTTWEHDREPAPVATDGLEWNVDIARVVHAGPKVTVKAPAH